MSCQAFAGEAVDHGKDAEAAAVEQRSQGSIAVSGPCWIVIDALVPSARHRRGAAPANRDPSG
jgi:hypothetical protein